MRRAQALGGSSPSASVRCAPFPEPSATSNSRPPLYTFATARGVARRRSVLSATSPPQDRSLEPDRHPLLRIPPAPNRRCSRAGIRTAWRLALAVASRVRPTADLHPKNTRRMMKPAPAAPEPTHGSHYQWLLPPVRDETVGGCPVDRKPRARRASSRPRLRSPSDCRRGGPLRFLRSPQSDRGAAQPRGNSCFRGGPLHETASMAHHPTTHGSEPHHLRRVHLGGHQGRSPSTVARPAARTRDAQLCRSRRSICRDASIRRRRPGNFAARSAGEQPGWRASAPPRRRASVRLLRRLSGPARAAIALVGNVPAVSNTLKRVFS
jgi:hypothetical protein